MRRSRLVTAVVLFLIGLVWIGQGTDVIKGSAMSGGGIWGVVGLVLVVAAAAMLINERRRPATPG